MTATILYEGNLRCNALHLQSGTSIETDAPTDNKGKGERFSPTDLVCTALATCILTTMAIKTATMGIELKGTIINVKKHMLNDPIRMIGAIDVEVNFPNSLILEELSDLSDLLNLSSGPDWARTSDPALIKRML